MNFTNYEQNGVPLFSLFSNISTVIIFTRPLGFCSLAIHMDEWKNNGIPYLIPDKL